MPQNLIDAVLTYAYRNNKGNYIMPWDHTKYVNHSFYANTMLTPYGFEIAIKDIKPGEQITNDYGTLNIIESFTPIDEGHDRKMVHPNDLATYFKFWDAEIDASLPLVINLQQPLKAFATDVQWNDIENIVSGKSLKRSILTCLYNE
ncbi:MAG: SET domain-containing protein-lysine N-methyltransferase [Bacteroidales bacterium]|nr:SET domain-containing protein-lysine N-methyltransferase [Bacteroidales bacterium]